MDCKLGWLTPRGNLRERTLRLRQKVAISPEPGFWTRAVSLSDRVPCLSFADACD